MGFVDASLCEALILPGMRGALYERIVSVLREISNSFGDLEFKTVDQHPGNPPLPLLHLPKKGPGSPFLLIVGAQHNEFSGSFGMIDFLLRDGIGMVEKWRGMTGGGACFVPIFNVEGFLHPRKENKWGYYLLRGGPLASACKLNLNRLWDDVYGVAGVTPVADGTPVEMTSFARYLRAARMFPDGIEAPLYILDFHETSLLRRYYKKMAEEFDDRYLPVHWVEKWIVKTVAAMHGMQEEDLMLDANIPVARRTMAKLYEELDSKTFFFLSHTDRSEHLAKYLDARVAKQYEADLVYTKQRSFNLPYKVHGSIVSSTHPHDPIFAISIEQKKIIFNLARERDKFLGSDSYKDHLMKNLSLNVAISATFISELILNLIDMAAKTVV